MSKAIQRVDLRIPNEIYTELEKIAVQKNIAYAPKTKPNYDGSLKTDKEGNPIEPRVAVTPVILELLSESLKKSEKVIPFKQNKEAVNGKNHKFIPISSKEYLEKADKEWDNDKNLQFKFGEGFQVCPFKHLIPYLPETLSKKIFIVTGLPAIGKTTFVYSWLQDFINKDKENNAGCFISYEMAFRDLVLRNGFSNTNNEFIISEEDNFGIEKIEQTLQYLTDNYDNVMLCIDFLQLIPSYYSSDSEATRVSRLVTTLKQLANKYNVFIIAISDVGKITSYNNSKQKTLNMDIVRDSYRIAYSSDMLFYLGEVISLETNIGLKILKNRFGKKDVYLPFIRYSDDKGKLNIVSGSDKFKVQYDF